MNVPRPRIERPDDMGDVLAEIRRLVAHGGSPTPHSGDRPMVVTARVVAGDERQPSTPQSLALSVELPMSGPSKPGHAASTVAPVDATGKASVSLPVAGEGQAPQGTPFRLNPDAMIPAADPASPLRLPPSLSVAEGTPACPDTKLSSLVAGKGQDTPPPQGVEHRGSEPWSLSATPVSRHEDAAAQAAPLDAPHPIAGLSSAMIRQADTDPFASGPTEAPPLTRESDMQAHANAPAIPLQAEPTMQLVSERPAPEALQDDEENPLRALLREVVREEFEGELKRNLNDDLRRIVRTEIAAALTEALVRRPRG